MKAVIDTCSLLSLVRYYQPFDKEKILFKFIKNKIKNGDIIIIDKVIEECKYTSRGLVLSSLNYLKNEIFLKESNLPYTTKDLLAPAPKEFLRQLQDQFVNETVKRQKNITKEEFEKQKSDFLNGADMRQIILCLNLLKAKEEDVILVTDESESSNDNKLFKKIPAICKILEIETMTLPTFLTRFDEFSIIFTEARPLIDS